MTELLAGFNVAGPAATVLLLDDDSSSSSSSSPSDDSSGSGSGPGSGGSSGAVTCAVIEPSCSVSTEIIENLDDHPQVFSTNWDIVCDESTNSITSLNKPNGTVTTEWTCELGSDGSCFSVASCDYFGTMATCELTGGFDSTGWSGTMSASIAGSLPDTNDDGTNSPIVESFDCSW